MNNNRGLFIGLTTIDIQYFVEEFPKPNIKINSGLPNLLIGGPAANAAVAFAKLNGSATLASAVGENSFSGFVQNDFNGTNVSFIDLMTTKEFSPVLATVVTSRTNGERNIFTHHPQKISPRITAEQLLQTVSPDIIMLDGFYPEFGLECAQIAKKRKIPVVLDCGSWKPQYDELLNFADFVICSENFFPQNTVNSQEVLSYLNEKNIQYSAISRGEKPILFCEKNHIGEIKIKGLEIVDSLGAGDVLHGAFCYYFLQGYNFTDALKKASVTASFSCKFKGTREWLNFLQQV